MTSEELIQLLDLKPLPMEGGFYRETYRSAHQVHLVDEKRPAKSASTAIYYLLTPETCSALHRLPIDEVYHFYLGDPVQLVMLPDSGEGEIVTLGSDLLAGQVPQQVVPADVWQGSCLLPGGSFALMGTTMAPGFDFSDYRGANPLELKPLHPNFASLIDKLTSTNPDDQFA